MRKKINDYLNMILVVMQCAGFFIIAVLSELYLKSDAGKYSPVFAQIFIIIMSFLIILIGAEPLYPQFEDNPENNPEDRLHYISKITKNRDAIFILYLVLFILMNKYINYVINDVYADAVLEFVKPQHQKSMYNVAVFFTRGLPNLYLITHISLFYVKCE